MQVITLESVKAQSEYERKTPGREADRDGRTKPDVNR